MNKAMARPVTLVFSGLDPTGGAGLQADIEAIASMGCHAAPIATCLTVQTTRAVLEVVPVKATLVIQQARAVLEDMPVSAVKIGRVASIAMVEAIHSILHDYPAIPVVLDPVLGVDMLEPGVMEAMINLLIPQAKVVTADSEEAMQLASGADTLDAAAMSLLAQGSEYVLLKGTQERTPKVINSLYGNHRKLQQYSWKRLEGSFHGAGCTLASAMAGLLAQGHQPLSAVKEAQRYTWKALTHGAHVGMGQAIPDRFFWINLDKGS